MTIKPYVPSCEEERVFLENYDPLKYNVVKQTTADVVLFTIRNGRLSILLVERGGYPYKGHWALPGGFVNPTESSEQAARRELKEETGIDFTDVYIEQLKTYDEPGRDPRMSITSTAYVGLLPDLPAPVGGDDATDARWWAVEDLALDGQDAEDAPALAFDHAQIIKDGLERVRSKFEYTPLATRFLDETFTLADLRRIYETVWGRALHPANFRRKVLSTPGFVVPLGSSGPSSTGGRSAALYQAGNTVLLHPAMLRVNADVDPQVIED